jgi:hypothetical protein
MSRIEAVWSKRVLRQLWKLEPGKWVATTYNRIIAVGDTPTEVYQAAERDGVETPLLYQIPDPNVHWYFAAATS